MSANIDELLARVDELEIENQRCIDTIKNLTDELQRCKNELCKECGNYRRESLHACEICRWY